MTKLHILTLKWIIFPQYFDSYQFNANQHLYN